MTTTETKPPAKSGRIVGLDVLRGFSVLLVVCYHGFPDAIPGGGVVGVTVFLALSGYIVTRLLLSEWERNGRIDVLRYARRRAVRLLPALWAMLAGLALVTILFNPLDDIELLPTTLLVGITYTTNLPIDIGSAASFHLWTLATEVQFYILWPLVLWAGMRSRRPWAAFISAAVLVILGCLGGMLMVAPDLDVAYRFPTSWGIALVIGACTALAERQGLIRPTANGHWAGVAAAVAVLAVLCLFHLRGHAWTYLVIAPGVAAVTCFLIMRASAWPDSSNRFMRMMVGLGMTCYGAYLWNYPIVLVLRDWYEPLSGVISMPLTFLMGWLSWRFLEKPLLDRWSGK